MKFIIVLILISVLIATIVPVNEAQTQCQSVRDCQQYCLTPDRCSYGTCYCKTTGK
uniref:Potassium channel toxin alpha-KTx 17.1 n=1 Tax=Olivierus martensii TaxID=34649 RepID=KA171_OLIMR|nr:RecName: Full=Potassium channel toxin alpha-KTx 17.1; AltName: Full=BmKK4; AltName: Full=Toxin Kk4; AltName: Full=Toxin TXKs4; Flags: Precursor [Mesobuthus martensii]AAK61821.1 toxin TXKs4 [Mesobuthus martensii]CAC38038.1 K+ toxin-like peptide [Mesobuthus martensii]